MCRLVMPFIAVSFLALGACALPAPQEEIDNAGNASFACMQRGAKTLDDRTSEAITVAYGIVAMCNKEIIQTADAMAQGSGLENRQYARRRMNEASLKMATEMVLKERVLRAQRGGQ